MPLTSTPSLESTLDEHDLRRCCGEHFSDPHAAGCSIGDAEELELGECGWYAMCANEAAGVVRHLILGAVPICQRCADKHELTLEAA